MATQNTANLSTRFSCNLFFTFVAAIAVFQIAGCTTAEQRDDDHYFELSGRFNQWLGKHRDERIKSVGPPNRCFALETREEVCEWSQEGVRGESYYGTSAGYGHTASWRHSVLFLYDSGHIAKSWSYNGDWGQFQSGRRPHPVTPSKESDSDSP